MALVAMLAALLVIPNLAQAQRGLGRGLFKTQGPQQLNGPGNSQEPGKGFVFGEPFPQETYLLGIDDFEDYFGKFEYFTVPKENDNGCEGFYFDFKSNIEEESTVFDFLEAEGFRAALVAQNFGDDEEYFFLGFPVLKLLPDNKNWNSTGLDEVLRLDFCCEHGVATDLLNALEQFPPAVLIFLAAVEDDAEFDECQEIDEEDLRELILVGTTLISFNLEFP